MAIEIEEGQAVLPVEDHPGCYWTREKRSAEILIGQFHSNECLARRLDESI